MAKVTKGKGKSAKKDKDQASPAGAAPPARDTGSAGAAPPAGDTGSAGAPPQGGSQPAKKDLLAEKKEQLKQLEGADRELEAKEEEGIIDMTVALNRQKRRKAIEGLRKEIKALEKGK